MNCVRPIAVCLLVVVVTTPAPAQPQTHPEHDLRTYPAVYAVAGMDEVRVRKNVTFGKAGATELRMDIYSPAKLDPTARRGVVVFVNGVGDGHGGALKEWAQYTSWPRLVAACGLVAVTCEARGEPDNLTDLRAAVAYLSREQDALGIDATAVGLWACSANVQSAAAFLAAQDRPRLKAAVLYYGASQMPHWPKDATVLVVRAAKDQADVNRRLEQMVREATAAGASWSLQEAAGHHAFDCLDDNDDSRAVVRRTLEFLATQLGTKRAPAACPAAAAPIGGPPPAARAAMAAFFGREWVAAAEAYSQWSEQHQDDTEALARLAQCQLELRRTDSARNTTARLLALDERQSQFHLLAGQVELAAQHRDAAISCFTRALELDPSNTMARFELGKAQFAAGRYAAAAASLDVVVRDQPGNGFAWNHLGLTCMKLDDHERAIEAFERVLRWAPDEMSVNYNLACACAMAGEIDRAFASLEHAVRSGYRDRRALEADQDLNALRGDPRYERLLASMR